MPNSVRRLPKTQAALDYARELHAGQSREADGAPFIVHPREVASLLYDAGAPDHLIAAGALHDVIEKTLARAPDLRQRFGGRVAMLVLALTENEHITPYAARKAALRSQRDQVQFVHHQSQSKETSR
jgi:(p)ppGpp synthase/HD superfamily hydrolase